MERKLQRLSMWELQGEALRVTALTGSAKLEEPHTKTNKNETKPSVKSRCTLKIKFKNTAVQ